VLLLDPPALVAEQIVDFDRATNGRVVLGIRVGDEYLRRFVPCTS